MDTGFFSCRKGWHVRAVVEEKHTLTNIKSSSPLGTILHEEGILTRRIREGRFQRLLAVVTGGAAILSGAEVAYEHYRGSYGQQIMYTPVLLSGGLMVTGFASAINRKIASTLLPIMSAVVMLDGFVGFIFHIRGIARKPGGWRLPVVNLVMGPPVFAPLLFGLSGYLGIITAFLQQGDDGELGPETITRRLPDVGLAPRRGFWRRVPRSIRSERLLLEDHIREGRFQRNIALVAGLSALFSGLEASYSHYENGFQYRKLQWSPIIISAGLTVAGIGSVWSRTIAKTLLPLTSAIALLDGLVGTYFHARGVLRRPGGLKLPLYNIMYGPPIFAPMLLSASGFMGLLASLLRRPKSE